MANATFKGYNLNEQMKIIEAEQLCERIDFSINGNSSQDYFATVYGEIVRQEMEHGTSVNEILEIIGDTLKETVDSYLATEKDNAEGRREDVYENTSFDFTVEDDYGLSFTINSNGTEYSVYEDFSVQEAMKCAVRNSYSMADKLAISEAESVCKQMDIQLREEPDCATIYGEIAEREIEKGTPLNEILKELGKAMEETLNFYLEAECCTVEENYERDILAETYLETYEEEGELKFRLNCNDRIYIVKDGDDIKDIIDEAIEEAKEEYETEQDEEEYEY